MPLCGTDPFKKSDRSGIDTNDMTVGNDERERECHYSRTDPSAGGCAFWYGDICLGLQDWGGTFIGMIGTRYACADETIPLDTFLDLW